MATYYLSDAKAAYATILDVWLKLKPLLQDGKRYVLKIEKHTRSLEQNKAQWPILQAFSQQLEWPVNGRMVKMEPDEWKDVLTAAFKQETTRLAMGLDGGVVMLGARTSKFTEDEFSQWLEFLNMVAADRGVKIPMSKREAESHQCNA